jgi:transcriptional regulator with XRE-family HTH domain
MPGKRPDTGPTAATVVANLHRLRTDQNLSYTELSQRLKALAQWSISPVGVRRIEDGERRVTVDDLLAFAVALKVSPATLLMPNAGGGDEKVAATGILEKCDAERLWGWLVVHEPLDPGESTLKYRLRALPPWRGRELVANVEAKFSGGGGLTGKVE